MRSFASDNNSGVHHLVLRAIEEANGDHAVGYGDDPITSRAKGLIKQQFGELAEAFFVFNGTGANSVAIRACTNSYHSIICSSSAHIAVDECGAPTAMSGCQLKEIETSDGKLTPALIEPKLIGFGEVHHTQPKVIYISECSEFGTIYTTDEIKNIADLAHSHDMYLHMDGARLANAAAALGCTLRAITVDCGVDILSFGGTKNGMMLGEAVVSFRSELTQRLGYIRKQSAQLYSKMRYTSAQFIPYLTDELWRSNALHANIMAQRLKNGMLSVAPIRFTQSVDANILLLELPRKVIDKLLEKYFFYIWNEAQNEIRLVTSFDTTDEDVANFLTDFACIYKSNL